MKTEQPETYVVTFTPASGFKAPGIVRLRHLLKLALRTCGLRVVTVRPQPDTESNGDPQP